jgi:hypothetical protein
LVNMYKLCLRYTIPVTGKCILSLLIVAVVLPYVRYYSDGESSITR